MSILKPRNDFVVVRVEVLDEQHGIKLPQGSVEGKQFFIEAIGPKVEDLKPGDQVLMTGQEKVDWSHIPNHKNRIVIREGNVVLKFMGET